jgi:hypothetical protein
MVTTSSTICRCTRRGGTGRLRVIGVLLLMLFSLFSASYAQFVIGQARVVSVTPSPESPDDPAGCVRQRLIGQTEYWYIQQDRRYTVRLEGVECDGEQIQVVLYDPGRTPNDPGECYEPICLTAQRVGEGVYEFTYRFPTISEKGYYVRYCTTDCNPATGFVARRSDGVRAPAQLHLAYFTPPGYNPPCEFLIEDKDCTPPGCVKASEDVELPCNPDPDDIPSECDWKRDTYFNEDTCIIGVPECVPDPDTGLPYTEIELPERGPCWRARVFTYRVLKCDGEYCEVSRKFIWQEDREPPVIHNVPDSPINLGCVEEPPNLTCEGIIAQYNIFVTDNCDPSDGQYTQLECEAGEVQQDGCRYSQTFTFWARDKCGNYAERTLTFTWQIDPTPPVLEGVPQDEYLGCFPNAHPTIACETDGQTVTLTIRDGDTVIRQFTITASDDCDPNLQVECLVGELRSVGNCLYAQTVTIRATNKCGLATEASVTFTWQYDPTPPVIKGVPDDQYIGCFAAGHPEVECTGSVIRIWSGGKLIYEFPLNVFDDCDPNLQVECEVGELQPLGNCRYAQTVTVRATNKCGLTTEDSVTFTWQYDPTPPVIKGVPDDQYIGCFAAGHPEVECTGSVIRIWSGGKLIYEFPLNVFDDCDPNLDVECMVGELQPLGNCRYAQRVTVRATNKCGLTTEDSVTFTWQIDPTPPVLEGVPQDEYLGCFPNAHPTIACETDGQTVTLTIRDGDTVIRQFTITASDDCDPNLQVECEVGELQSLGNCLYAQTVTIRATNKCGLATEASVTFTWQYDPTPPVIKGVPDDQYIGCFAAGHPEVECTGSVIRIWSGGKLIYEFPLNVFDDCDPNLQVECEVGELQPLGNCRYAQTVTVRATNKCGLTTEDSVTFTWQYDPTPPVIKGVPDDQYIGCFAAGHPEVECTGSVIRIWSGGKLIYEFPLNVFDDCDPNLDVECMVGELQPLGNCRYAQRVTVRATNKCGLTTEDSVTFTWQIDPTPPVLEGVPQDEYLGCFPNAHPTIACETDGQTVTLTIRDGDTVIRQFTITASDDCDPNLQVECEVGELQSLGNCLYAQTVTIRATNKCGLTTEASVTFTWQYDPVPPVVNNVPENHKLPCNTRPSCDLVIALFNIEAKDNCDPNPTLNCEAGPIEQIGPCEFRQSFTFWAVDKCGNRSADYVTVMLWKEDTEPPVLHNVPEGGDLGCNPTDLPECDPNVTATDNCTENVNVICTPSPIITIGCLRLQYFTYTAADECGNAASQTVLYWWTVDTTPPIVRCPDDITVQLQPGDCFAEVVYRAKAHDDCDPTVREAVCNPPSGTFFEIGQHTVTCSATDRCGNTGTCSFTVTVYGYICGLKFEDLNGNGTRDPGEPGVEGWTIILLASDGVTVLQTTQTGPDGSFCFFGLLRGTYFVVEEDRPGWVHTTPRSRQIDLPRDCGKQVVFGNRRTR